MRSRSTISYAPAMMLAVLALIFACMSPALAFADDGQSGSGDSTGTDASLVAGGEVDDGSQQAASVVPQLAAPTAAPTLKYRVKLDEKKKLSRWTRAGRTAGRIDKKMCIEVLKVKKAAGLTLRYNVRSNGKWKGWKKAGAEAGKRGKRMNAVRMQLTGALASKFDIAYRVYVRGAGWQPWAVNGAVAGKNKKSTRVEGIQIKLVQKRTAPGIANGSYYITTAGNTRSALAAGGSLSKANLKDAAVNQRFYIRNQSGSITVQSVSNGRYVCDGGGSVALKSYSDLSGDSYLWKPYWDGGYYLINAETGMRLTLSGSSAKMTAGGTAWSVSPADIIPADKTYSVINVLSGDLLDVKGESQKNKANVQTYESKRSNGSQVFKFKRSGDSQYRLINCSSEKGVEASGSNVRQNKSKNKKSQKWSVSLDAQGRLVFTNVAARKVLTAAGDATSGANVGVSADKGAANQRWTVKATKFKYRGISGDKTLDKQLAKINKKYSSLRSAFRYVVGFSYRNGARYWGGSSVLSTGTTRSMAKDMLSHHSGNCYRFASLFCWIAKSRGYEARVRSGWVASASGGQAPHGWTEVKVNGSWLICDPDLAHELPGHNWYMVSYGGAPTAYHFW